jgi:hypothetical protein
MKAGRRRNHDRNSNRWIGWDDVFWSCGSFVIRSIETMKTKQQLKDEARIAYWEVMATARKTAGETLRKRLKEIEGMKA